MKNNRGKIFTLTNRKRHLKWKVFFFFILVREFNIFLLLFVLMCCSSRMWREFVNSAPVMKRKILVVFWQELKLLSFGLHNFVKVFFFFLRNLILEKILRETE